MKITNKRRSTTIVVLGILLAISSVYALNVLRSQLSVPSGVEVQETEFKLSLFEDPACTIIATRIVFSTLTKDLSSQGSVNSSAYYLRPAIDSIKVMANWNVSNSFDSGSFVIAGYEWSESNGKYNAWEQETQYLSTDDLNVRQICFGLKAINNPSAGSYDFEINFWANEVV